jgi:hypothetical protein
MDDAGVVTPVMPKGMLQDWMPTIEGKEKPTAYRGTLFRKMHEAPGARVLIAGRNKTKLSKMEIGAMLLCLCALVALVIIFVLATRGS